MAVPDPSQQEPPLVRANDSVGAKKRLWLRGILISGIGVVVSPFFGLVGTILGMRGAFGELSKTEADLDSEVLADQISISVVTTMIGMVLSVIALIFLIVALIRYFTLPKIGDRQ